MCGSGCHCIGSMNAIAADSHWILPPPPPLAQALPCPSTRARLTVVFLTAPLGFLLWALPCLSTGPRLTVIFLMAVCLRKRGGGGVEKDFDFSSRNTNTSAIYLGLKTCTQNDMQRGSCILQHVVRSGVFRPRPFVAPHRILHLEVCTPFWTWGTCSILIFHHLLPLSNFELLCSHPACSRWDGGNSKRRVFFFALFG